MLLIRRELFYIVLAHGNTKPSYTSSANKNLNCIPHSLIIVVVSFGTQIQEIYEDQPSSHRLQSLHSIISHTTMKDSKCCTCPIVMSIKERLL